MTTAEEAKTITDNWIKNDLLKEGILKFREPSELNLDEEKTRLLMGLCYESILEILKKYCALKEDDYKIIALWIIGTYLHKEFECYPYLFLNATKGSGKTRTLKLITALSKNGDLLTSLREAVLFRISSDTTLGIDEFESLASKENQPLRELLNASYKKGTKVKRMKKVKGFLGEEQKIEEFEPYKPIVMANIWGMDDVLGDRSITIVLDKSDDDRITREIEDFSKNKEILFIKTILNTFLVYKCSYFGEKEYIYEWNNYVNTRYNYTTTLNTYNTLTTLTTLQHGISDVVRCSSLEYVSHYLPLFNSIHDTGINGRSLELFFPLFLTANYINESILKDILSIASKLTNEKRKEEMMESKDVMLIDFISSLTTDNNEFFSISDLIFKFRQFAGIAEGTDKWINSRWFGRALKRLSLILDKRRMKNGIEVTLNIQKAKEKIQSFKK